MTLGYDPRTHRFVGTFIATGNVLTLHTKGPSFADERTMCKYQDIITIIDDDHRTLSSQVLGADGRWARFMTARYQRIA